VTAPFVGEIRAFGFNFAPTGWAACDGQLLQISQYTALFSLLGTQFGGDGKSTFALPNLGGQVPINQGQGAGLTDYEVGESGGADTVTLTQNEIGAHVHNAQAVTAAGSTAAPGGALWAEAWTARSQLKTYSDATGATVALSPAALDGGGGNQPHENRPPLLVMNFCIALQGIYPSRS